MKYIIITSKHHDGFAMFNFAASTYDIIDSTLFQREPLNELDCRNRHYSPHSGRWLSPDRIGFGGMDLNLYRYVGNSPTLNRDPYGQGAWSWVPGVGIAMAAEAAELALSRIPGNYRCKEPCLNACDAAAAAGVTAILTASSISFLECGALWWNPWAAGGCIVAVEALKIISLINLDGDLTACKSGCNSLQ